MKGTNVYLIKSIIKNINKKSFKSLDFSKRLYLYAGDVPQSIFYKNAIGLSINKSDNQHIKHDIRNKHDVPDNTIDIYQSEDVFEHIEYEILIPIINDIYRILKPGGLFRLSIPDYRCDVLYNRSIKNDRGEIIFDPFGGGKYKNKQVVHGGHLWFPMFETVNNLLNASHFTNITYYHYYDEKNRPVVNNIDYSYGYVQRTPDNDERVNNPYRPMSIVVDCIK